jgi:hypothetical protein
MTDKTNEPLEDWEMEAVVKRDRLRAGQGNLICGHGHPVDAEHVEAFKRAASPQPDIVRALATKLYNEGACRAGCDLALIAGVRAGLGWAAERADAEADRAIAGWPALRAFAIQLRALAASRKGER